MSLETLILGFLAILAVGIGLAMFCFRKVGAVVAGLSILGVLALLPWQSAARLMRTNRTFRSWAAPRMNVLMAAWAGISCAPALAVALSLARTKSLDRKDGAWKIPKESKRLDKALRGILEAHAAHEKTLLGVAGRGEAVFLEPKNREAHMQIVGPTRCGKSQLLFAIAGQDMKRNVPVFFMEAKGDVEDFDHFHKLAGIAGRAGHVRYFNPQDPRSMTFNPIRPVPGQDARSVAEQIARAIGREPRSTGEGHDYYDNLDFAKIQTMAELFMSSGRQFSFRDCFHYFTSLKARRKAYGLCRDSRIIAAANRQFKQSEDCSAITSLLQPWISHRLGSLLNAYSPQIRIEEIFSANQLAYFAIPVGYLPVSANALGRMLISGLMSVGSARQIARPKPGPASVVLDEFAQFATPAFSSFISTIGSARLQVILSHQDLGQLAKVAGTPPEAFRSEVFSNTSGSKICFRAPDPKDAEFWAQALGTYDSYQDTERVRSTFLGEAKTGERSRRAVSAFMVHPNAIKSFPSGCALALSAGQDGRVLRTARVHTVLEGQPLPALPHVQPEPEEGLDLASVADEEN